MPDWVQPHLPYKWWRNNHSQGTRSWSAEKGRHKVYHIRNERRRNGVSIIWMYLVHCETLVWWSSVLPISTRCSRHQFSHTAAKNEPTGSSGWWQIVACIFIFSARSRISLRRAHDEVRARLARSRALQPIPVVKRSSKLDMAADPQPDWLSCLPSSWSYGVTRDGRIFFIK